jgi:hypothetical protein
MVIAKQIAKNFQDRPDVMVQELRNQLACCQKYTHKTNKIIIPHHRTLAVYILTYFKCDLLSIDPEELMKIFGMEEQKFI